jgi:hypothetical protein
MSFAVSRRALLATVLAAAVVGAGTTAIATINPTRAAAGDFAVAAVEDDGADCAVTVPGTSPASSRLPDPFRRLNGTRISTKSDWRCRRAEIRELAERFVYG